MLIVDPIRSTLSLTDEVAQVTDGQWLGQLHWIEEEEPWQAFPFSLIQQWISLCSLKRPQREQVGRHRKGEKLGKWQKVLKLSQF